MRKMLFAGALLTLCLCQFGCSSDSAKTGDGTIGTTAPINNKAPEAANAPAAPSDPSIQYPGGGKKAKKM